VRDEAKINLLMIKLWGTIIQILEPRFTGSSYFPKISDNGISQTKNIRAGTCDVIKQINPSDPLIIQ
jgi:hypothetical protein